VFDSDSWGETVEEFLHSLGRLLPFVLLILMAIERPLFAFSKKGGGYQRVETTKLVDTRPTMPGKST
jgi:hypothetical protein